MRLPGILLLLASGCYEAGEEHIDHSCPTVLAHVQESGCIDSSWPVVSFYENCLLRSTDDQRMCFLMARDCEEMAACERW